MTTRDADIEEHAEDSPTPATGEPAPASPGLPEGWSYTPGPQPVPPTPAHSGAPPGRGRKRLWIAVAAAIGAIVVACILAFVVFNDEPTSEGPSGATSTTGQPGGSPDGAEEVVRDFFQAMEDKDIDAFFALLDPVAVQEFLGGLLASEEAREALAATMFDYGSVVFSDLEFSTVLETATTASVTVTAGIATMTDSEGVTRAKDATEAGLPVAFELIQRDGIWYVNPGAMIGGLVGP